MYFYLTNKTRGSVGLKQREGGVSQRKNPPLLGSRWSSFRKIATLSFISKILCWKGVNHLRYQTCIIHVCLNKAHPIFYSFCIRGSNSTNFLICQIFHYGYCTDRIPPLSIWFVSPSDRIHLRIWSMRKPVRTYKGLSNATPPLTAETSASHAQQPVELEPFISAATGMRLTIFLLLGLQLLTRSKYGSLLTVNIFGIPLIPRNLSENYPSYLPYTPRM